MAFFTLVLTTVLLSFTSNTKKVVVIDVGHGGKDNGSEYQEYFEKDITLKVAQKIRAMNNNMNLEIVLTREVDDFVSLKERVEIINTTNPDFMISLHVNESSDFPEKQGAEFYFYKDNKYSEASAELTRKIKTNLNTAVKTHEVANAGFYVLKNANCPATMVEMGFINNKEDRAFLTTEEGLDAIALNILAALED